MSAFKFAFLVQLFKVEVTQLGSETKSRQMFHTSRHFHNVTFSQICTGSITRLCFYQLDAEEILLYQNQGVTNAIW